MNFIKKFKDRVYGKPKIIDYTKVIEDIESSFMELSDSGCVLCVFPGSDKTNLIDIKDKNEILQLDWNNIYFGVRNSIWGNTRRRFNESLECVMRNLQSMENRFQLHNKDVVLEKKMGRMCISAPEQMEDKMIMDLPLSKDLTHGVPNNNIRDAKKFLGGYTYDDINKNDILSFAIAYKIKI